MKEFFRSFFASLLAFFVFCLLLFFIIAGIISGVSQQFDAPKTSVKPNTVLRINTNYAIVEQTQTGMPTGLGLLGINGDQGMGLNDILINIKNAETDDHIKGIYLELGLNQNAYATLQEIRDALEDFKKNSGKFVIAYGEVISQSSYYLGSIADKIYMNPSGAIDFKGLSAHLTFYKGTLDKLGVKTQIFYDGKFKSATEPFRSDKMSEENRLQLEEFLGGLFNENLNEINSSRSKSIEQYKLIADSLLAWHPEEAVRVGLIDELKYFDEVETDLKTRCGLAEDKELEFVTMKDYKTSFKHKKNADSDGTIAIVYADGTIVDGKADNGFLGSQNFTEMMQEVRNDKTIKAVVLRVNSPGGSAVASDVMWREIEITKKVKPIVVSMGDYAASGGYMISCNANKIYAQPNTLTGSIGVFLIIPEISGFMNDKLGITFDTASTSQYADFPSLTRPFSERERFILQSGVDSTYLNFKRMVAAGRNMTVEQVEEIAQGRIWIGAKAKEIGLVDEIGGIDEAIKGAVELSGLKAYEISEYPKQKPSILDGIITNLTEETAASVKAEQLGILYPHYVAVTELLNRPVIQAKLPYEVVIK
ncbi:MAG: signal peptide peptidase SppA [Chitinophagales bacterium]|jgi:protease-4|nr:signal peptide peptidase SppA [Chitinophagales bacterium]MBP9796963.1 signal peptide peptidase SppA [Chitinophagales bacterium]